MSLGVYADWAHAKGKNGGNLLGAQDIQNTTIATATNFTGYNVLNAGDKFDAYSLRATLAPTRRTLVGLGYGYRKTSSATVANSAKHQIFDVGASYMIYQNNILSLTYINDKQTLGAGTATTIKTTSLDYLIML